MTTEEALSAIYTQDRCPGCGKEFERPRRPDDTVVIPGHTTGDWLDPVCWLAGWTLAEARAMLRMREENNGRLTHAAHP